MSSPILTRRTLQRALFALVLLFAALPAFAQRAADAPDPWSADIAAFEAADRTNPPAPGGVLFIGSSSIRFWTSLEQDFPDVRIVRRGFGGSEVRDSTHYADRIVVPYKPRLVLLYAGDNDLAAGRSVQQVVDDFKAFVARVRKDLPDTRIAYIAIKPSPARANLLSSSRAANDAIAAWAKTQRGVELVDIFTPMLDANGVPREDIFLEDRLHMNRAGYAIWIETIGPVIRAGATKP
ncbi:GDSL-type esterase/lipase family protein [Dokdonella sp. MW10]|uniref:SGNH/GDSL hydrolase family protein n=1 Tax=Dokdonella sp. MW10 TaxID=2992926 RepID=UPI003F82205D